MKCKRFQPKRYQLKKEGIHVLSAGHPWIFRSHLSSASSIFEDGQWLRLVDHENVLQGYGVYEADGLIGIRVLKRGKNEIDRAFIRKLIEKALMKREQVRGYTNAFRAIHGENDGLPGIVIDVYGDTAVLQTYSPTMDTLGRYVAQIVFSRVGAKNLIWKVPSRRKSSKKIKNPVRVLRGVLPERVKYREGKLNLTVEIEQGQKSGTFLDLRGLRKWIAAQKLGGLRVLNLFSYTGTLGLAAEVAGADEIWNVDVSQGALDFAKKFHTLAKDKHKFIAADIFEWLPKLNKNEKFDLIIMDPPSMASKTIQVPKALAAYKQIYRALLPHLTKKGRILACCCTSRIARKRFRLEVDQYLDGRLRFKEEILPEDDHPVGFSEGDYLKLLVYGPGTNGPSRPVGPHRRKD